MKHNVKRTPGTIGERMTEIRLENKLTQHEMCDLIGAGYVTAHNWETGMYSPNAKTIINFCRAFNISADYLLGLTEEKRKLR